VGHQVAASDHVCKLGIANCLQTLLREKILKTCFERVWEGGRDLERCDFSLVTFGRIKR
jgi:hypothetical protein